MIVKIKCLDKLTLKLQVIEHHTLFVYSLPKSHVSQYRVNLGKYLEISLVTTKVNNYHLLFSWSIFDNFWSLF